MYVYICIYVLYINIYFTNCIFGGGGGGGGLKIYFCLLFLFFCKIKVIHLRLLCFVYCASFIVPSLTADVETGKQSLFPFGNNFL